MSDTERKLCKGNIFLGTEVYETPVELEFFPSGEVIPHFPELDYRPSFDFVHRGFYDDRSELNGFSFEAISPENVKYYTDRLVLNSASRPFHDGKYFARLKGFFSYLLREEQTRDPPHTQYVAYFLKGFESFGPYIKQTPLGRVSIKGASKYEDYNHVGGVIGIRRSQQSQPPSMAWEFHARAFLDYLHRMMKFARSCTLSVAFCEAGRCSHAIKVFYNPRKTERPFLSPIHFLNSSSFFDCCIDTYFCRANLIESIKYGIDWLNEPQHYNELRLIVRMMALENFVEGLLDSDEKRRFPRREFRKIRATLLENLDGAELEKIKKPELVTALSHINIASLREKVDRLIEKYNVPMEGLSKNKIHNAIGARNDVVHRGVYYVKGEEEQDPLWIHITVMNEILVRLVFMLVGYRGMYTSWLDGMAHRDFPSFRKGNH